MPIINRVAAMRDEVAVWRRDFHAHPEIGFEVNRTAGIVANKLKAFGCDEVVPAVGKTGVVGIIKGRKQGSGKVAGRRSSTYQTFELADRIALLCSLDFIEFDCKNLGKYVHLVRRFWIWPYGHPQ